MGGIRDVLNWKAGSTTEGYEDIVLIEQEDKNQV
jgi:hypothetical protein